jgi:integrase
MQAADLGEWEEVEDKPKRFRPAFRVYDLRHTCATLLLAKGENPKIVSERLGHASIVLTLDTYSHVLPHMQEAAVEKMEAMFGGL